jgi:hypothetical protein
MDRATRDKLVSRTNTRDLTTGNACWETAPAIFKQLNEDFGPFDVDLTADAERHLCPQWFGQYSPFGPNGEDVLSANASDLAEGPDWSTFNVVNGYSNPPYGRFIADMLMVAKMNAFLHDVSSTLLLPLRLTKAFHAHVLQGASELLLPDKRLVFFEHGAPRLNERLYRERGKCRADVAVFDSVIVRYAPFTPLDATPNLGAWPVPPHVSHDDLERARIRREALRVTA